MVSDASIYFPFAIREHLLSSVVNPSTWDLNLSWVALEQKQILSPSAVSQLLVVISLTVSISLGLLSLQLLL